MASGLDLSFSEDQQAISAAVHRFCLQHDSEATARRSGGQLPRELWQKLAALGVFSPAAPGMEGAGGALEICAISEALGHNVFPGPVAATFLAIQVLTAEESAALIDGRALVSLSNAGNTLLPWGLDADIFLVADESRIYRAGAPPSVTSVDTLGGEPWGRGTLEIEAELDGAMRGLITGNIARAAYLASAGLRLVTDASNYATTRKQFGKALGDFQAVTQPLADCAIAVTAAQTLARAAACHFDSFLSGRSASLRQADIYAAGAAFSASRAALKSAFVCHQVFAGIGITLEGPVYHISRRIRQLASQAPGHSAEQELLLAQIGLGV